MRAIVLTVSLVLAVGCGSDPVDDPPPGSTAADGHVAGHWAQQWWSPDRKTVLGTWSGECESPSAWFGSPGQPWRPVVAGADGWPLESYARGWSADGRARVFFTTGLCGSGIEQPGTYLVTTMGAATFVSADDLFSSR